MAADKKERTLRNESIRSHESSSLRFQVRPAQLQHPENALVQLLIQTQQQRPGTGRQRGRVDFAQGLFRRRGLRPSRRLRQNHDRVWLSHDPVQIGSDRNIAGNRGCRRKL